MRRLTIRLPDSLHKSLQAQAHDEGISLNQFIVYQLTRSSTGFGHRRATADFF